MVKKEIAEIKKAKQERQELEKNLTYVQPSKLIKDRKNDYFLDHGIFCFDGSVLVPDCKEVYLLKLEVNGNIIQNIDENMAKIFKTFGAEDENWKDHIEFANGVAGKKMDPSQISKGYASQKTCSVLCKDTMVAMDQAGSLYIVKPDTFEHPHYLTDSKNIKNYFFVNDKEDPLDNTIVLDHKEVALRDLNTEFQKTVNLYNSCSPELNLALHDVKIMENVESGEAIAVFRALSNYKGVYFSPDYITFQDTRLTEGKSFVGFRMYQMFHSEEDLFCMRYLEETSYLISKEEKKVDKVIDFDSALNILEQTVPHDKLTTIESAEFLYQTYYEGEEGQQWEWICENAPEFYAFPVWRFVEKERTSEMQATVYYINAVTGKVYSFYETCLP